MISFMPSLPWYSSEPGCCYFNLCLYIFCVCTPLPIDVFPSVTGKVHPLAPRVGGYLGEEGRPVSAGFTHLRKIIVRTETWVGICRAGGEGRGVAAGGEKRLGGRSRGEERKKERRDLGKEMAAEGAAAMAVLPREYGYVMLVMVLYAFLNFWMAFQVSKARRR